MRFPEFNGEWNVKRLDECVTFLDEQRKPIKSTERSSEYKLYPYYGASGVIDYVDDYIFNEELILLSEDGANILDRNYRVAFIVKGKTWVNNHAHVLRPMKNVDISYLSEYLESLKYEKYNTGSTMPKLNQEVCRSIKILLPEYAEQVKIGILLSAINERIATQIKIIEKLESLIKGLTDNAFCCNGNTPMVRFSSLYKDAGEGGTPSTSNSEYYEGGTIPFVKIDDLTAKYLVAHKDCITEEGLKKSSAWLIPTNSVIYSNGATIGAISINTYPVCTKQGILGIIPKDNVNVEYLYYLMTSVYFRKEIHRIITEGTMKTAYLKDINKILCPLPNIGIQKSIADKLSSITKKIELEYKALSSLQRQKRYFISQLFI